VLSLIVNILIWDSHSYLSGL